MKIKTSPTIWIGKKAYFLLMEEERTQRGCKPLSKEQEERIWKRVKRSPMFKNGQYNVSNESFGGGDGTYNGKWWSWSVEDVMRMLDDAGLKYRKGKEIEYIEA